MVDNEGVARSVVVVELDGSVLETKVDLERAKKGAGGTDGQRVLGDQRAEVVVDDQGRVKFVVVEVVGKTTAAMVVGVVNARDKGHPMRG